jgi:hypothetical protein
MKKWYLISLVQIKLDSNTSKIHRVFFSGVIGVVFGPRILQKSCLPSEQTGPGNFSSLLAGSYSDFEPFFKRTSPWAYFSAPEPFRHDKT